MTDLISREAAIKFAEKQMVKETGAYSKGWNAALLVMKSALNNPDAIHSVDAVPLEPLATWIVENLDPSIDCRTCAESPRNYECACLPCPPMSEKQVKEALEKWMEGQDADRQ